MSRNEVHWPMKGRNEGDEGGSEYLVGRYGIRVKNAPIIAIEQSPQYSLHGASPSLP